jgi:glycosyltransferase involved in cell wall biosynthesis
MATVSIIIPAYNPGPYLRTALESVHAQTFDDWECVVVNDNSTEDLSWVVSVFPRVRYVRQAHGGVSVARNNGVLRSAGEFIAFMDQDDVWAEGKLERQLKAFRQVPEAGICYCDLALIDADGKPAAGAVARSGSAIDPEVVLDPRTPRSGASALYAALRHFSRSFVVPSTVMIRRECLAISRLLDPFIPFSGDYDLLIKLGSRYPVVRVPSADTFYRKRANNFSDKYDVGRAEVEALVARYIAYGRAKGDRGLVRDAGRLFRRPRRLYAAQAFDCARRSLRQRDYRATCRHLRRSLWFSPAFVAGSIMRWATGRLSGKPGSLAAEANA